MKKKICIISISLGKGGLERFCANLSCLLYEYNYEVHLVTLNDDIDYQFKGCLFNLGKYKTNNDNLWKRLKRFVRLHKYFRNQKFDYIIDNRVGNLKWRELYYAFYIYGFRSKVIYMQHNANIAKHFPNPSLISKLLIKYAHSFIGVSSEISKKFNSLYRTKKCNTIYNFIQPLKITKRDHEVPYKYIISLGRLDDHHKNISLLLESYKKSNLIPNYKLLIMGSGSDEILIKKKIDYLGITNDVILKPFNPDIFSILSNAHFLVLTSRYEGFPMVLGEALSVNTPIVSVDCESGPSEIIINEKNGLLIKNHNPEVLSDAMNRMIFDEELYNTCKANAKNSINHLFKDQIIIKWNALLC